MATGAVTWCSMAVAAKNNVVRLLDCIGEEKYYSKLLTELGCCSVAKETQWTIDNKYYTADVTIITHDIAKAGGSLEDIELTPLEAVIFLCLSTDDLETVKNIWEKLSSLAPPVCLLVAVVSGDDQVTEGSVKWCVQNGIELVEWNQEKDNNKDDDIEDDNDEGVPRISQALQAHMWPYMTRKGNKKSQSKNVAATNKPPIDDLIPKELYTNDAQGVDPDPGGESFEELFSRFASMKAHAESLPHEERKAYAEKVVMSFWKAIGGDDDELDLNDNISDKET